MNDWSEEATMILEAQLRIVMFMLLGLSMTLIVLNIVLKSSLLMKTLRVLALIGASCLALYIGLNVLKAVGVLG